MVGKVGYAIVGCGTIGRFHAAALKKIENAALIGVYDAVPQLARDAAESFGVKAYSSLTNLLEDGTVSVVILCTPSGSRLPIAQKVAEHRKNLLVEKPLEATYERAKQIVDSCRQNGVTLGCVLQYRFYDDIVRAKRLLQQGALGRIVLAEAQIKWHRSSEYYSRSKWRGTWALDGGGVLMNQSIHTIDLLQWLVGSVAEVSAYAQTLHHPIETEDTAAACVLFDNGALGAITATTATYPGLPATISIHGTEGSLILSGTDIIYLQCMGKEVTAVDQFSSYGAESSGGANPSDISAAGHARVIADMTSAILQRRDPSVTGEEALKSIDLIGRIYDASHSNRSQGGATEVGH